MAFHILINKLISSGCFPPMGLSFGWSHGQDDRYILLGEAIMEKIIADIVLHQTNKKFSYALLLQARTNCLLVIPKSYCHCLICYPSYNLSWLFSKLQYYSFNEKMEELLIPSQRTVNSSIFISKLDLISIIGEGEKQEGIWFSVKFRVPTSSQIF